MLVQKGQQIKEKIFGLFRGNLLGNVIFLHRKPSTTRHLKLPLIQGKILSYYNLPPAVDYSLLIGLPN